MWKKRMRRFAAALVVLAVSGCSAPSERPPNIVLIVIDTLRADRLGCYGNERGLTPFLDSFAEHSFVFHRAYAQSSWTNPAMASLFTSRFPSQHGVTAKPSTGPVPGDDEVTLVEALRKRGYVTAGFVANGGLGGAQIGPGGAFGMGFGQGFDVYKIYPGKFHREGDRRRRLAKTSAGEINTHALDWLLKRKGRDRRPLFLYLHYMEPHSPYAPSPEALARVGRDKDTVEKVNARTWRWNLGEVAPEDLQRLSDVYDAEVATVDAALSVLFSRLQGLGVLDHAIVVVTADHGEEMRGHGVIGHGDSLFEALIHVPLLIRVPGITSRVDLDGVVSEIDVAPTLLELVDAPAQPRFQGRSLRRLMRSNASPLRRWLAGLGIGADPPRVAVSELVRGADWPSRSGHRVAAVGHRMKLIIGEDVETYDLIADPGEQKPGDGESAELAPLEGALENLLAQTDKEGGAAVAGALPLDKAAKERLRALGYDW